MVTAILPPGSDLAQVYIADTTTLTQWDNAPLELRILPQWVGWLYRRRPGKEKLDKVPINPRTGSEAKTNASETWGTYKEAQQAVKRYNLAGVGFVFTPDDAFAGIDLDDCRNRVTEEIESWATRVIRAFGSYCEVSPSGTGVKIIVRGRLPDKGTHRGKIGMFDRGRFFAITGQVLSPELAIRDTQEPLERLYKKVNPTVEIPHSPSAPVEIEDEELLGKARRAKNGRTFVRLFYKGDTSGYSSHSEADLALCGMLAFWTGRDTKRMDRLFRTSKLYRPKWERQDYRERTIETARSRCQSTYTPKPSANPEAHRILEELATLENNLPWEGRSGPTDAKLYGTLINTGCVHGSATTGGVLTSLSARDAALMSGVSDVTAKAGLRRLEERGMIECVKRGKGRQASTYLLKARSSLTHIEHLKDTPPCVLYGEPLSATIRKIRNPAPDLPEWDKNGRPLPQRLSHLLGRLGGLRALILARVAYTGGLSLSGLESSLRRPASNIVRLLPMLLEAGLLLEEGGVYRTPTNLLELLERELEESGCNEAEQRARARYERERQAYHAQRHESELTRGTTQAPESKPTQEASRATPAALGALIPDPADPEQFREFAALMRKEIARRRGENPQPRRRDPLVHYDTPKTRFYDEIRTEDKRKRLADGMPSWIRLAKVPA